MIFNVLSPFSSQVYYGRAHAQRPCWLDRDLVLPEDNEMETELSGCFGDWFPCFLLPVSNLTFSFGKSVCVYEESLTIIESTCQTRGG